MCRRAACTTGPLPDNPFQLGNLPPLSASVRRSPIEKSPQNPTFGKKITYGSIEWRVFGTRERAVAESPCGLFVVVENEGRATHCHRGSLGLYARTLAQPAPGRRGGL